MFRQMSSIGRNELLKSVVIILFLVGFMGIVIYEFAEMVTNEEKCIELQITVLDDEVAGAGSYTYVAMDGQPSNVSIYSYKGDPAKHNILGNFTKINSVKLTRVGNNTFAGHITLCVPKDEVICVGYPEKYKTYPKNNFINGKSIVSVGRGGGVVVHHWKCTSFKDVAFFGMEATIDYFTPYLVRSVSLGNYGRGEITFSVDFSLEFEKNFSEIKIRYENSERFFECTNNTSFVSLNLPVMGNPFVYPYDVYIGNITIFAKENGTWKNITCKNETFIEGKEWSLKFAGAGNITILTFIRNSEQKVIPIGLTLFGIIVVILSSVNIFQNFIRYKNKSKYKGWLSKSKLPKGLLLIYIPLVLTSNIFLTAPYHSLFCIVTISLFVVSVACGIVYLHNYWRYEYK